MKKWLAFIGVLTLGVAAVVFIRKSSPDKVYMPIVSLAVNPGQLSAAHAFLDTNCAVCHTPRKGVEAANCVTCHANNTTLLQMQPTAFHAHITSCSPCHAEHQGRNRRPTQMNHGALAQIGLRELGQSPSDTKEQRMRALLFNSMGWQATSDKRR